MVQLSDWIDLWDRASCLIKHQDAGITLHERLQKFLSEFSKLQNEAFAAQKKLCEKYIVDVDKIFGVDNSYGIVLNSFIQLVQRIIDTESLISGSFEIQASGDLKQAVDDEKKRYKRWKNDREKLSSEMKSQIRIIDDEIKRYRDKYRDMVKATEDYSKIEADKSHSQLDVEKARSSARLKTFDFERARKDYSAALNQFNLYRSEYFNRTLPVWAHAGYQLEQDRHARTQTLFGVLYERVRVATERLGAVCADLQNVSAGLDLDRDVEQLIARIRTGHPPPNDIVFVDLANAQLNPAAQGNSAPDSASDKSSTGAVYASSSVVLPANFHCSVSAADFAALESAGLVDPNNVAAAASSIYAGTGSIYSAFSATMGNGMGVISRRPSISGLAGPLSPTGHGPGLLRRFFSRRSRHDLSQLHSDYGSQDGQTVSGDPDKALRRSERKHKRGLRSLRRKSSTRHADPDSQCKIRSAQSTGNLSVINMKMPTGAAGEADLRPNGLENTQQYAVPKQLSTNGDRDLLDSSDFSDTSFESDAEGPPRGNTTNAYAATSVLVGINRAGSNNNNDSSNLPPSEQQPQPLPSSGPQDSDPCTAAPLAEPESLSMAPSVLRETSPSNRSSDTSLGQQQQQHVVAPKVLSTDFTNPVHGKVRNGDLTNFSSASQRHTSSPTATQSVTTNLSNEASRNGASNSVVRNGCSSIPPPTSAVRSPAERTSSRLPTRPPPLTLNKKPSIDNPPPNSPPSAQHSPVMVVTSETDAPISTTRANPAAISVAPGQLGTESSGAPVQSSTSDRRMMARKHFFARKNQLRPNGPPDTAIVVGSCTALYPFSAEGFEPCYLAFDTGEKFYTLAPSPAEDTNDWLRVIRFQTYESGYVPTAYVEQQRYTQPLILPIGGHSEEDQSSQSSTRTVRVASRPPHSPVPCARVAKSTRMLAPSYNRVPGATRDTEL